MQNHSCFPSAAMLSGACAVGISVVPSHDAVARAPPRARGFCKGSRCAAVVRQESPSHPHYSARHLSVRPDSHQQVRMSPGLINTTAPHTLMCYSTMIDDVNDDEDDGDVMLL